ncbi:bifunctional hydroxymethylpyrimidine kinase/phosphomethylpyrimidine kinase [Rodentibacter caecimuris]|uniref:hydroxymethylpyrimidine kinase n=1 Tax=Rodentibacter caecimuris TaxID=1796644 RepID=A0ABX3L028_9PAST|nr:bifunctional hydroxymethylpyrimidine kinase/phosphomethylpyrimidine kinase [Rodentibacter heylii]
MSNIAQTLTIAGSDSGGGAGIQADLKTFQMCRVFGTSVITAITAQNTLGVFDIHTVPLDTICSQIEAVTQDFSIKAFKIGMLGNAEIIECVADAVQKKCLGPLVFDPVMIAKGGANLLEPQAVSMLISRLLPLTDVLTPNLPEVEALTGIIVNNKKSAKCAAQKLQDMGVGTVIIKGGHFQSSRSEKCIDWVLGEDIEFYLESPRYVTAHTHGTGCTFSACITAELAKGKALQQAVVIAKQFVSTAIRESLNIGHGHGPINHWAYQDEV